MEIDDRGRTDRALHTPAGPLLLERRPVDPSGELRAWDAADQLLIEAAAAPGDGPVLVVGDSFGALVTALRHRRPVSWSDSAVSHLASAANLARQDDGGAAEQVADPQLLLDARSRFDVVLWRVPRAMRALRHQASVIQVCAPGAVVLAAGMDKHLPPDTRSVLAGLGHVRTHPGVRKAHLFEVRVDATAAPLPPMDLPVVPLPDWGLELQGGHESFSPDRLDLGARVLGDALKRLRPAARVADLCCGGGVLGLVVQHHQPQAEVHYFDESWSAVDTARRNVQRNVGEGASSAGHFHWTDGMHAYEGAPFDAIVCNPPFHQHGAVTDAVAWQLFHDARANLVTGGELWVVGNRHLGYHAKLRRLFGNCRQVATHPKFVALVATRR